MYKGPMLKDLKNIRRETPKLTAPACPATWAWSRVTDAHTRALSLALAADVGVLAVKLQVGHG